MALVVIDSGHARNAYPNAVVWHIDDDGYLHIAESDPVNRRNADGTRAPKTRPVATFAPGRWESVHVDRQAVGPFSSND